MKVPGSLYIWVVTVLFGIYRSLPPKLRFSIRGILKGYGGHRQSLFDDEIGIRDACGKNRLDRVCARFTSHLKSSDIISLEEQDCLEVGTGYVGSLSLVLWLLGARLVYSIDLNPILQERAMRLAVIKASREDLRKILSPFVRSVDALDRRIDMLFQWAKTPGSSSQAFFTYKAPASLTSIASGSQRFDFITSVSVLEHIPANLVVDFLMGLSMLGKPWSFKYMHLIDMTDHLDHLENPLGFLALNPDEFSDDKDADRRGNRIRMLEWGNHFNISHPNPRCLPISVLDDSKVPANLQPKWGSCSRAELLVGEVLVVGASVQERHQ